MKSSLKIMVFIIFLSAIFSLYFFSNYNLAFGSGESMKPTLRDCPLLVIDYSIDKNLIEEGEIALINISGIEAVNPNITTDKIAHRVVENDVINQKISTRGDNNEVYLYPAQIDGRFDYSRVLGKVIFYVNFPKPICDFNF